MNQESKFKIVPRISLVALSAILLAAGCVQRQSAPLEAVTSQTMRDQTPVATSSTLDNGSEHQSKPTLQQKDPYQSPPYVPDYKQSGPPPEAQQDELPAQTLEHVSYRGQEGKNALDLLKASHKVDVKTYSGLGEFVDGIDGVKSDTQHFWSFYVNGKQATVGAGSYTTKTSELIEWKFEKIK